MSGLRFGCARAVFAAVAVCLAAGRTWATPPVTPTIVEPATDGQIVHPADVHMATAAFSDPDPGDQHRCSEWELWTVSRMERVWKTECVEGVLRVHVHLGDGTFEGSRAGRYELASDTDHLLRVRHWDTSNEVSDWAQRTFHTSAATQIFPIELDDILSDPRPVWVETGGDAVTLPGGALPPALRIESPQADLLVGFVGPDTLEERPPLDRHVPLLIVVDAGGSDLALPPSRVVFTGGDGAERTVYLPALALKAGQSSFFWVSIGGSTYVAQPDAQTPDFSVLAQGAATPWTTRPGFDVAVVSTGFQLPVNIAFAPVPQPEPDAPLYYITELYGSVKVVGRDGSVRDFATNLLNFNPLAPFPGSGEGPPASPSSPGPRRSS